jgi:hypothetical protein
MGAQQGAVERDLNGVVDDTNPNRPTTVTIAHPVGGPGKAHRAVRVDLAQNLASCSRSGGFDRLGATVHLVVIFDEMASCVRGDHDPAVSDVQESV